MNTRLATGLLCLSLLGACVSIPPEEIEWPANIPPKEYYNEIYDQDEANQAVQSRSEYLTWVIRFYEGWTLYEEGWHWTTNRVMESLESEEEKARVSAMMSELGARISAEWSKDASNRHIFTRTISAWGQALLESVNRNEEEALITRVSADIDSLFAGELEPDDIVYGRYYEEEEIEFF